MPLTNKGNLILKNMKVSYGAKKGKSVFYASINKGTVKGAEASSPKPRHKPKVTGLNKVQNMTGTPANPGFVRGAHK